MLSGSEMSSVQGPAGAVQRLIELLNTAPARPALARSLLHPPDPLTPDEISVAAKACREAAEVKGQTPLRFNAITLQAWHSFLGSLTSDI